MGEEATHLENEIRRERAGLAGTIQALEQKAHRAGNWRYQYAKRPVIGLGLALAGGFALARLATNGRNVPAAHDDEESPGWRPERGARRSGLMAGLQGALLSVVATELRSYLRKRVLNTNESAASSGGPWADRTPDA